MATYALTFATRADFDTSLASGDIYTLMQGVTSSAPSVAIAAHITESGETFACGTNVMVDIKSVGPGDYVLYDTTNAKFFGIASKWIDNNYPNQPTQHILIFKEGVLPARYTICGTVIKRFGNRIRIAGVSASLPWTTTAQTGYDWLVGAVPSTTTVMKNNGADSNPFLTLTNRAFPSLRYLEAYYPSGNADYLPITRATWDAAVAAGETQVTQNNKTATLADWDYSYDKWLSQNFAPKFPAPTGAYSKNDGHAYTRAIVADFIANHDKTAASVDYAAGYCDNYAIAGVPGLQRHDWFLGCLKDTGEIRALTHTLRTAIAWRSGTLWSSSQYHRYGAWIVAYYGTVNYNGKYYDFSALPLADLTLNT